MVMKEKIDSIILRNASKRPAQIKDDQSLSEIGIDDLIKFYIREDLETEFDIIITDSDMNAWQKVADIYHSVKHGLVGSKIMHSKLLIKYHKNVVFVIVVLVVGLFFTLHCLFSGSCKKSE